MSVRAITDGAGVVWQVWEVIPGSPRTDGPPTGQLPNVWGGASWPTTMVPEAAPHLEEGWLVFMTESNRRRLAPIPRGWADLDDARLLRLLDAAA